MADSTVQRPHSPPNNSQPGKTVTAAKKTDLRNNITGKVATQTPALHKPKATGHFRYQEGFQGACGEELQVQHLEEDREDQEERPALHVGELCSS